MLLPNPAVLIVQVGCLFIIAYVLIDHRRAMRRIRARVEPFSADNPSGQPITVLRPQVGIVHRGAIRATIVLVLITFYSVAEGLYEWGPDYVDRWMDPENLAVAVMVILLLLIIPGLLGRRSTREFFLVSDADLTHIKGKDEERIPWKDVSSITTIPQGQPLLVRFSSSRKHIDAHLMIENVERLYEVALRRLPEPVRDSEAYAWMTSQVAGRKRLGAVTEHHRPR